MTGERYTRLVVLAEAASRNRARQWRCLCDCGAEVTVAGSALRGGRTKSCGCLNNEMRIARNTKHGGATRASRVPEYTVWQGMISRCQCPKNRAYRWYGGAESAYVSDGGAASWPSWPTWASALRPNTLLNVTTTTARTLRITVVGPRGKNSARTDDREAAVIEYLLTASWRCDKRAPGGQWGNPRYMGRWHAVTGRPAHLRRLMW